MQRARRRTIHHVWIDLQDLHRPHEAGVTLLPEPGEVGHPLDRIDEDADAEQEGEEIGNGEFRRKDAQSAEDDDQKRDDLGEGLGAGGKPGFAAVAIGAALDRKSVV